MGRKASAVLWVDSKSFSRITLGVIKMGGIGDLTSVKRNGIAY
jgi:hypothetical protein